ncbi:MAG: hypothetical protein SFW67_05795 [Myxococcaceae bacterium]|nr:hypothetical protein [Myxococcaceae bacterium]
MSTLDLISLAALEVACDEGVTPHLGRLEEAAGRTTGTERFVLERVLEALRIHLALLQRRPDALWPSLYAHCAFVDSPRARRFDVSAPGPDMPMFQQVGRWLDERRALHPDGPWLKALTPTTPWGGALEAELRVAEPVAVRRVEAEATLVWTGAGLMAWHVGSGRLSPAQPPPTPPREHLTTPRQGGLVLAREGQSRWLLDPNWSVSKVVVSDTGTVAACIAWEDEGFTAFAFDLTSGHQLAGEDAGDLEVALSPNGRFLAFRDFAGVTIVRDLSGGARLGIATGRPGSLAISNDGRRLAQVEEGVVRQYRPHPGPWPSPFPPHPLETAFTRDGSKLLVGPFILDGAEGGVLLRHGFTAPQFLEGGPAPFSTRLTPQRLCVNEGFRAAVLDFQSERLRVMDELRALDRSTACWSGDGLVYAMARRGDERLVRFDGQATQRLEARGPIEALALDETGSRLACLLSDGTLSLQPQGAPLRQVPGGRSVTFLANDTAIAVSGIGFSVVLGFDGQERFRTELSFDPTDAGAARLEVRAGLRPPSRAESLEVRVDDGLVEAGGAVFPADASSQPWLRSPRGTLLAKGNMVLSFEGTNGWPAPEKFR